MDFKKIIPHKALGDFIECYIYGRFDFPNYKEIHTENPFLPTHKQLMLIDLDDEVSLKKTNNQGFSKRKAIVVPGIHLKHVTVKFSGAYHRTICVCFRPGGLYRLLGLPIHEMVNQDYSGGELFGKASEALCDQLKSTACETKLWLILDKFFLSLQAGLRPLHKLDTLIREIMENPLMPISIDEISLKSNMCVRQTERLFKQRLGVSPKLYLRLMRFSNAHTLKEHCPNMTWTSIAHAAGYFDQMHLIKDFKEFAGFTPTVINETDTSIQFRMLDY